MVGVILTMAGVIRIMATDGATRTMDGVIHISVMVGDTPIMGGVIRITTMDGDTPTMEEDIIMVIPITGAKITQEEAANPMQSGMV